MAKHILTKHKGYGDGNIVLALERLNHFSTRGYISHDERRLVFHCLHTMLASRKKKVIPPHAHCPVYIRLVSPPQRWTTRRNARCLTFVDAWALPSENACMVC